MLHNLPRLILQGKEVLAGIGEVREMGRRRVVLMGWWIERFV